jgi:hypothetical protein
MSVCSTHPCRQRAASPWRYQPPVFIHDDEVAARKVDRECPASARLRAPGYVATEDATFALRLRHVVPCHGIQAGARGVGGVTFCLAAANVSGTRERTSDDRQRAGLRPSIFVASPPPVKSLIRAVRRPRRGDVQRKVVRPGKERVGASFSAPGQCSMRAGEPVRSSKSSIGNAAPIFRFTRCPLEWENRSTSPMRYPPPKTVERTPQYELLYPGLVDWGCRYATSVRLMTTSCPATRLGGTGRSARCTEQVGHVHVHQHIEAGEDRQIYRKCLRKLGSRIAEAPHARGPSPEAARTLLPSAS